eukprot:2487521-Lingulodinium_polyedra.AAC.1
MTQRNPWRSSLTEGASTMAGDTDLLWMRGRSVVMADLGLCHPLCRVVRKGIRRPTRSAASTLQFGEFHSCVSGWNHGPSTA